MNTSSQNSLAIARIVNVFVNIFRMTSPEIFLQKSNEKTLNMQVIFLSIKNLMFEDFPIQIPSFVEPS